MTENNLAKDFNAKTLTLFALPTMIMILFESLYGIVDGIFVARLVNIDAFSSINIIMPAILFFMGIGTMFGIGGSAIVAKKMGEGKWQEARENFSTIALALAIVSILTFVISFIFIDEILSWLGATERLMPYARTYFGIILIGMLVYMGQFLFQSFFIVAGKPKIGLICVVGAGVTNMVLDYVFIVWFGMGIGGAAWATSISCAIPNIIGLIFFFNPKHSLHFVKPKKDFDIIYKSGVNGSASMVNFLAVGIIVFLLNKTMLTLLGETGVAAITVIASTEYIFNTIIFGYTAGISPVVSFNYGARKKELLSKILKISFFTISALSAACFILLALLGAWIVRIYASENSHLYAIAVGGFAIFMYKYILMGVNVLIATLFTAFNKGKIATFISLVRTFGLIIPMLLILPRYMGVDGVWAAVPIAEVITFVLSLILFVRDRSGIR
jgi:putative MATE family efflux protein